MLKRDLTGDTMNIIVFALPQFNILFKRAESEKKVDDYYEES